MSRPAAAPPHRWDVTLAESAPPKAFKLNGAEMEEAAPT